MKIVHVLPVLTKGGAERVAVDLAINAAALGHEVTILTAILAPAELLSRPLPPAVKLRQVDPTGRSTRMTYHRLLPWLIRNRRWLFDQDVIHCHLTFGSVFGSMMQRLRALYRRTSPVAVETYHAVGMAIPKKHRALHAALLSKRDAVAFMADDPYWTRFRQARPGGLFVTIPNGIVPLPPVDRAASATYRARTHIPDGATVVGSVGRLAPARRPDLLIETFAHLARVTERDLHLLLAGEGPERERLQSQVRALGIADRVHLPGLVLDPREPLGLIDLYLTVNVGGITGIAALEAVFSGVPVIALQLQPDYCDGANDWIPSYREPAALAAQAAILLGDGAARNALAARQQAYAGSNHGIETMAQAYDALYRKAIDRTAKP